MAHFERARRGKEGIEMRDKENIKQESKRGAEDAQIGLPLAIIIIIMIIIIILPTFTTP